jgi:hypothetical protein
VESLYGTSSKTTLNSGHRFFGIELRHTKSFFMLSHHFTAMSTVVLHVAITGVTSLLWQAMKNV